MDKGISIYFAPDDLAELREFIKWKTDKRAGHKFASVESNFDLKEANSLIKKAQLEKQQILRQIEAQRGSQQELDQQREDVSLLPDREAERIQAGWAEAAKAQAEHYAIARNKKGTTPRSVQDVDPSITDSVLSWIKKQRLYNKKN